MVAYGKCALIYLNYKFFFDTLFGKNLSDPKHIDKQAMLFLSEPPGIWGENKKSEVDVQIKDITIERIDEVQ